MGERASFVDFFTMFSLSLDTNIAIFFEIFSSL